MLNVSERSIQRANTVQAKGTPEEIKAVEEGRATVTGVAQCIKARQKNGNGKRAAAARRLVHFGRRRTRADEEIGRTVLLIEGICDGIRDTPLAPRKVTVGTPAPGLQAKRGVR